VNALLRLAVALTDGRRQRAWVEPVPMVGLPAVVLGSWGMLKPTVYRDVDGRCRSLLFPGKLLERSTT
jgi:hypothetical protein